VSFRLQGDQTTGKRKKIHIDVHGDIFQKTETSAILTAVFPFIKCRTVPQKHTDISVHIISTSSFITMKLLFIKPLLPVEMQYITGSSNRFA
jgi:hypothetical protein